MDIEWRRAALAVLARGDSGKLQAAWAAWADKPDFVAVRAPEVGLVMLRGRAGGGGAPFNLGEASVSRASIRLASGEVGHGYCLGRDPDKARLIALFDALAQREPARVEEKVLAPLRRRAAESDAQRRGETAATKVNFFTLVRGED